MQVTFSNQVSHDITIPSNLSAADGAFKLATAWLDQGCSLGEAISAAAAITCEARWACVNKIMPAQDRVQILALFDNGIFTDCFDYQFHDTPCEEVLASEKFCRFDDVQRAFPEDKELEEMGVVDYAGKAFRDVHNNLLGHMVIMHDAPMVNDERLESVICRLIPLLLLEWNNYYD